MVEGEGDSADSEWKGTHSPPSFQASTTGRERNEFRAVGGAQLVAQGCDLCCVAAAAVPMGVAVGVVVVIAAASWVACDEGTTRSRSHSPEVEAESGQERTLPGLHPSPLPLSSYVPKPSVGRCPRRPHQRSHLRWAPKSVPRLSDVTFPSPSAPDSLGGQTTRHPRRPTHPSGRLPSAGHSSRGPPSTPNPPR